MVAGNQPIGEDTDRVRAHASLRVTQRLDEERLERVRGLAGAEPAEVTRHLEQLDRTWDVERLLAANASTLILVGSLLAATRSKRWLVVTTVVPGFLLQHAVQGWCPPVELFRYLGVRTRNEIDAERTAIKALRGDFVGCDSTNSGPAGHGAQAALSAAGSR